MITSSQAALREPNAPSSTSVTSMASGISKSSMILADCHTFEGLKNKIAYQERPANGQKHLCDADHHGDMAFHVRIIHAHNTQQR